MHIASYSNGSIIYQKDGWSSPTSGSSLNEQPHVLSKSIHRVQNKFIFPERKISLWTQCKKKIGAMFQKIISVFQASPPDTFPQSQACNDASTKVPRIASFKENTELLYKEKPTPKPRTKITCSAIVEHHDVINKKPIPTPRKRLIEAQKTNMQQPFVESHPSAKENRKTIYQSTGVKPDVKHEKVRGKKVADLVAHFQNLK